MEKQFKSLEDFWDYQEIEVQFGPGEGQTGIITKTFNRCDIEYFQVSTPTVEGITVAVTSCRPAGGHSPPFNSLSAFWLTQNIKVKFGSFGFEDLQVGVVTGIVIMCHVDYFLLYVPIIKEDYVVTVTSCRPADE